MQTLTPSQVQELQYLKGYFPYRIVFGIVDKDTGKFEAQARVTMRCANDAARKGHSVFVYGVEK